MTTIDHEPENLARGYEWLVRLADPATVSARVERVRADLARVGEGSFASYEPVTDDRVAWYLLLAQTARNSPTNLDYVQAARVLPFISAIGRNIAPLEAVGNIDERVRAWLAPGARRTPDATLFELLVAAIYSRHGWLVHFVPESPLHKTPDLVARRDGEQRSVECKRLQTQSAASREESIHWARQWIPLAAELLKRGRAVILDVVFHKPMESYSEDYLLNLLAPKLGLVACDGLIVDNREITIGIAAVDEARIARELASHRAKCGTTREVQLLTGRYHPLRRFSSRIVGLREVIGEPRLGPADYWDAIDFACGAYWDCDAPAAIQRKARDVRARLAEAAEQIRGTGPGSVHIGIETVDGELVENARYEKVLRTFSMFDARGTGLDHVYCHLFGPEAPPDKQWEFAETCVWHRRRGDREPISGRLLVTPEENAVEGSVHWAPERKFD